MAVTREELRLQTSGGEGGEMTPRVFKKGRVMGLVCSYRRMGNTEISVREVLSGVEPFGLSTELIRLTDHRVEPCRGCMSCVFKGGGCPIDDDAQGILQRVTSADALVLGAPTYILGAAGVLKMLSDRSMGFMACDSRPAEGKPAVGVVTAGVPGWEGLAPAMVRIFLYSLGFRLVGLEVVHAQGPGEVLLDEDEVVRLRAAGDLLGRVLSGKVDHRLQAGDGDCPLCGESVISLSDGQVRCLICGLKGRLTGSEVMWEDPKGWRWGAKEMKWHFDEQVRSSGPRYMAKAREIRRMVKDRYRRRDEDD